MLLALYLVLLIGGILAVVAGVALTRLSWRDDIEPYHKQGPALPSTLQLAVHPERFAKPDRLTEIRWLHRVGALLLGGAVVVVVYDIVVAVARG